MQSTSSHGISIRLLAPLARGLERLGADVAPVLAELRGVETIDEARARALFDAMARDLGRPLLGLDVVRECELGTFGFIDYCTMTSPTLRDAIERVARYVGMLSDRVRLHLDVRDDEAVLVRTLAARAVDDRHLGEFTMGIIASRCTEVIGPEMKLRSVFFRHAPGAEPERYAAFFGCAVRFEQPRDALVFDAALLQRHLKTADPTVASMLDAYGKTLRTGAQGDGGVDDVRREIAARLSQGTPTLAELAKATRSSARTLQRRLTERGTSLRALVDEVRRETAFALLDRADTELTEVAFLLGFSEPAPFFRAFRRWTKMTPQQWRARPR